MTSQTAISIPELETDFNSVTRIKQPRKKRMAPLSVRLSKDQREQLERDAARMSLNAYVLGKLFDGSKSKRKRHSRQPTKRDKAIASALRRLAHSGIATYLMSQIVAREEGRLMLCPDEEMQLREAYAECFRIRRDLVEALGLETEHDTSFAPVTKGK